MKEHKDLLMSSAGQQGISLNDKAVNKLLHYAGEIDRWSRVYNLTGATGIEKIIREHIADSLSLLTLESIHQAKSILDIGTGAGLPGIVLAILLPETEISLLEANGKKIRFLKNMVIDLRLNASVLEGRAEELGHNGLFRGRYDLVTARAVARMNILLELSVPFLRVGGHVGAMKGPDYAADIAEATRALKLLQCGEIHVKNISINGKERYLLDIIKLSATPETYPRRTGIPGKRPL